MPAFFTGVDFGAAHAVIRLAATALLLLALLDWPYGYYQLVRISTCAAAAYTAVTLASAWQPGWRWTFGLMAVLFNPVVPIHLSRPTWAWLDLIAAVLFVASLREMPEDEWVPQYPPSPPDASA